MFSGLLFTYIYCSEIELVLLLLCLEKKYRRTLRSDVNVLLWKEAKERKYSCTLHPESSVRPSRMILC